MGRAVRAPGALPPLRSVRAYLPKSWMVSRWMDVLNIGQRRWLAAFVDKWSFERQF
jgi:hypothetical protein